LSISNKSFHCAGMLFPPGSFHFGQRSGDFFRRCWCRWMTSWSHRRCRSACGHGPINLGAFELLVRLKGIQLMTTRLCASPDAAIERGRWPWKDQFSTHNRGVFAAMSSMSKTFPPAEREARSLQSSRFSRRRYGINPTGLRGKILLFFEGASGGVPGFLPWNNLQVGAAAQTERGSV